MSCGGARASSSPTDASVDTLLKQILQSLSHGVAVADPESHEILFENAKFFEWFPPDGKGDEDEAETLAARIADFDPIKAGSRIEKRGRYTHEATVGAGARAVSLALDVRPVELDGRTYLITEAKDVSKQREAEYLLDSYSKMSERHARELQREHDRAEKLLLNIMPRAVYEELKDSGFTTPQRFDEATILLLDFVGFTDMAISQDPTGLIAELNDIFGVFDRIVDHFGCERMKTIGDAYMAVGGLPEASPDHAENIARIALRMRRYIERRNESRADQWRCRIGIHSGPVIGSIVGVQKYVYDVFGPGANLAARMETLAEPGQILISADTYELIQDHFVMTDLGEHEIKGFGTQRVYSLEAESKQRDG
jgi:adenylate cyclase